MTICRTALGEPTHARQEHTPSRLIRRTAYQAIHLMNAHTLLVTLHIPYGSCRVFVAVGRRLRVTQGRRVWLCIFCLVMARIDWPPGVPRRLDR